MKQYFGLGLAMLAGTVIGAAAVSGLHAQAKPPVYLITEIDVTNPEAYGAEFAPKAQATIKAAGGRFVVIAGTAGVGAKPITAIAGTPPKRLTIQVWDSMKSQRHRRKRPSITGEKQSVREPRPTRRGSLFCGPHARAMVPSEA